MPTARCCSRRTSGQSLFVSAKLEGLGSSGKRVSGDLRLIARRVFLDKLPLLGAQWPRHARRQTASARRARRFGELAGERARTRVRRRRARRRRASITSPSTASWRATPATSCCSSPTCSSRAVRGWNARPDVAARLSFDAGHDAHRAHHGARRPRAVHGGGIHRGHARAAVAAHCPRHRAAGSRPPANCARCVSIRARGSNPAKPGRSARSCTGGDFTRRRTMRGSRELAARMRFDARQLELIFDPANASSLRMSQAQEPRPLALSAAISWSWRSLRTPGLRFEEFSAAQQAARRRSANGSWGGSDAANPLALTCRESRSRLARRRLDAARA